MNRLFLIIFLIFFTFNSKAQLDRGMNRGNRTNDMQRFTNNSQKEKKDPLQVTLEYFKKELSLDSFQEAAIKVYLIENQTNAEKIHNSDISNEEKKIKFEEALKDFDEKILKILNPEQIKVFEELKDKNKEKSKKKKKKEEEN